MYVEKKKRKIKTTTKTAELKKDTCIRKGEIRKRKTANERPSRGQAVISILSPFVFVFRVCT